MTYQLFFISSVLSLIISLCGNSLFSVPPSSTQGTSSTIYLGQWGEQDNYHIYVHQLKDSTIYDNGLIEPEHVRSSRIYVEYENKTTESLEYRGGQWLLYDKDGHSYDNEIRVQFYEDDAPRKLKEGIIQSNKSVRGWVAFQVPEDAELDYVQFRSNYLSDSVIDVILQPSPDTK